MVVMVIVANLRVKTILTHRYNPPRRLPIPPTHLPLSPQHNQHPPLRPLLRRLAPRRRNQRLHARPRRRRNPHARPPLRLHGRNERECVDAPRSGRRLAGPVTGSFAAGGAGITVFNRWYDDCCACGRNRNGRGGSGRGGDESVDVEYGFQGALYVYRDDACCWD